MAEPQKESKGLSSSHLFFWGGYVYTLNFRAFTLPETEITKIGFSQKLHLPTIDFAGAQDASFREGPKNNTTTGLNGWMQLVAK